MSNCGTKGQYTEPKAFSGLVKTYLGVVDDESGLHYLRPETAQGIFVNFSNVLTASRKKPPFGIGQVGKAFRNEITPGNFIFRTREFEQMEIEFFTPPADAGEWFEHWVEECWNWFIDLGIDAGNMRRFDVPEEDRAHYSAGTIDVEYRFGFPGKEWGELMGVANRTDYDLKSHTEASGQSLTYFDQASGEKYTPYVIEPSFGLTRAMMAFLVDAYREEEAPNAKGGTDTRTVLGLDPRLAPVKVAVLPLSRNEKLSPLAREVSDRLRAQGWATDFDDAGAIGRRYRRQDEIGTPLCVTVDFDSLDDDAVTVRDRDTMAQERVAARGAHRLPLGAPARRLIGQRRTRRPVPNSSDPARRGGSGEFRRLRCRIGGVRSGAGGADAGSPPSGGGVGADVDLPSECGCRIDHHGNVHRLDRVDLLRPVDEAPRAARGRGARGD